MPATLRSLEGCRVLVVDDDPDTRELFLVSIHRCGGSARAVERAHEALSICGAEPVHVVVSDLFLPDMSGRVLAERLSSLHPRTKRVLVTGHHVSELAEWDGYLQKPVEIGNLVSLIAAIAARSYPD